MSFADLRQTVLRAHCFSTAYFAETVQIVAADESATTDGVLAKIEAVPPWMRRQNSNDNDRRQGTIDEREWIRVTLNRDATLATSYPNRPQPGTTLCRAESRDPDRRPFTFRGEIVYEGDQHAVYVFERPRRFAQGRGIGS